MIAKHHESVRAAQEFSFASRNPAGSYHRLGVERTNNTTETNNTLRMLQWMTDSTYYIIMIFLLFLVGSVMNNITRASAMSIHLPTAIVTGSTDGIGVTTAKNLALKGYNVIIHGRNTERLKHAANKVKSFAKISDKSENQIFQVEADISTIEGCKSLVNDVKSILEQNNLKLDVLMNNAGVFEKSYHLTKDGLETTFAVNVIAPFIITSNLLPFLLEEKEHKSRIVIASSISQCRSIDHWDDLQCVKREYSTHRAYSESKLLDAMLAAEFAGRFEKAGISLDKVTCNSLDPGTVNTKMLLAGWGPIGIDVEDALGAFF